VEWGRKSEFCDANHEKKGDGILKSVREESKFHELISDKVARQCGYRPTYNASTVATKPVNIDGKSINIGSKVELLMEMIIAFPNLQCFLFFSFLYFTLLSLLCLYSCKVGIE
jgi:hypothetical protein